MKRIMFLLLLPCLCLAGCHWEAKLGLGTVTASSTATVEEWAQANFLKAVDELIAKVPDPNKKDATEGDGEETNAPTDGTVDAGNADGG